MHLNATRPLNGRTYAMSRITLVVPTGALEWAERMLLDDGGAPVSRYETPGMLAEMASARDRALHFVRAHAATIAVGPTLFHVGGTVQRATSLDEDATFAAMDYHFCLLGLLDGDAAATVIQKYVPIKMYLNPYHETQSGHGIACKG